MMNGRRKRRRRGKGLFFDALKFTGKTIAKKGLRKGVKTALKTGMKEAREIGGKTLAKRALKYVTKKAGQQFLNTAMNQAAQVGSDWVYSKIMEKVQQNQ